ncbi:DEGP9, partial [Symbiodinium natans]
MVLGPLHLPLVLLLPLQEVAAWRHAGRHEEGGRGSSALQSSTTLIQSMWGASETTEMEVISSSGVEKVLCTQRLPYFRNRLCLQLKSHSAALEGAISAIRGSSGPRNGTSMHRDKAVLTRALKNPLLALPDLTIDLAWMGCSTCVPEMRVCSADQICRKDPKDSLSYPWIRIFPLSLESLVAGTCYGVADLLVSSTAAAAFAPLLGFLAPYLAGLMGTLTARVFDDLLMGRYCIYLSTHLAQEVLGDQILAQ